MLAALTAIALTASDAGSSGLESLADTLVLQVRQCAPEPPLAISVSGASPELARTLASLLASRFAQARLAPVVLESAPAEAELLARKGDLRSLLRLQVTRPDAQHLRADGDVLGTWVNFWSGRAPTRVPGASSVSATISLPSAELPPLPSPDAGASAPLTLEFRAIATLPSWPAAVAIGNLDGAGEQELLALLDDRVVAFASDGGQRLVLPLTGALPDQPTREPFGTLTLLAAPTRIAWVSGRRAPGAVLFLDGGIEQSQSELTQGDLKLRPIGSLAAFAPEFGAFTASSPAVAVSARGGTTATLSLDGQLTLHRAATTSAPIAGAGSATCLADLDGDGRLELITTSPRVHADPDTLSVFDLDRLPTSGGSLVSVPLRWSAPLPPGRALVATSGDVDGDGRDEVLLGLWLADGRGQLILARRAR